MTEISGVIRWNGKFIRGLAETILERARTVRSSLKLSSYKRKSKSKKRPARKNRITKPRMSK